MKTTIVNIHCAEIYKKMGFCQESLLAPYVKKYLKMDQLKSA